MSFPNKDVIKAIIESYLSYRSTQSWGIKESETTTSQIAAPINEKLKICGEILLAVDAANSVADWERLVHRLAENETVEATATSTWSRSLISIVYDNTPLLLETLRAIRSYIISELQIKANQYEDIVSALKSNISKLEKNADEKMLQEKMKLERELSHFEDHKQISHQRYFEKITKIKDQRSQELKEQSFEEFEDHVLSLKRVPRENMLKLAINAALPAKQKDETPAATTTTSTTSDAAAAPSSAPAAVMTAATAAPATQPEIKSPTPEPQAEVKVDTPPVQAAAPATVVAPSEPAPASPTSSAAALAKLLADALETITPPASFGAAKQPESKSNDVYEAAEVLPTASPALTTPTPLRRNSLLAPLPLARSGHHHQGPRRRRARLDEGARLRDEAAALFRPR